MKAALRASTSISQRSTRSSRTTNKNRRLALERATLTISKTGQILPDDAPRAWAADQSIVEVTKANRQIYYQGYHLSLPAAYAGRQFYRTITHDAFLLTDPTTGEIVFSFPLPMVALNVRGRYVASYSIQGVEVAHATTHWSRKTAEYQTQFAQRQAELPAVLGHQER